MSFLERFKGKTQFLKKDQVADILGQKPTSNNRSENKYQSSLLKITQTAQPKSVQLTSSTTLIKKKLQNSKIQSTKQSIVKSNQKNNDQSPQPKKIIQNPFLIQNQFFLDEQQHQTILKHRKQEEIRQRIQKQRKKRQQIQQKMLQSMKKNVPQIGQKIKEKLWVKLGGLGPNIGGQEWTKKKILQQKMLKFADEIKKINMEKTQMTQSLNLKANKSQSERQRQKQIDPRTLGIKYSKSIQKPTFYTLQKTRYNKTEMKTYNSNFDLAPARSVMSHVSELDERIIDPQQNEFSNLKFERNFTQLANLENKHKEFKNLIYQKNF